MSRSTERFVFFLGAVRVFANGPGDLGSIPGRVIPKTQKMVLDASLLNTQHYKVRIKGKVEQSRKGVAPSPTPWCSSYRKGSLRVTLDYGRQQLYLFSSYIRVCFHLVAFDSEHKWHKALLMVYSMGLGLTRVCSLNGFQLVTGSYGGHSSRFLRVCSLICDMCLSLCVCWNSFGFHLQLSFLCVSVCLEIVFLCVCGLKFTGNYFY